MLKIREAITAARRRLEAAFLDGEGKEEILGRPRARALKTLRWVVARERRFRPELGRGDRFVWHEGDVTFFHPEDE